MNSLTEKELLKKESEQRGRIDALQVDFERSKNNELALERQLAKLVDGLKKENSMLSQRLLHLQDNLADVSPEGLVERVLKMPVAEKSQLLGNIDKMKLMLQIEKNKGIKIAREKSLIEVAIADGRKDNDLLKFHDAFFKWADFYKVAATYFFDDLLSARRALTEEPTDLVKRCDRLKLEDTYKVALNSIFRPGELNSLSMEAVVGKVANLSVGDAYLPKIFNVDYNRVDDSKHITEGFAVDSFTE